MENAISHNRIKNRLAVKLHEKNLEGADAKEIEKIERILAKHDKFDAELQNKYDECKDVIQHGIPMLVDQKGEIKDKDKWIIECQSFLNVSLNVARTDEIELKETTSKMERFVTLEIVVRDAIYDVDTYKLEKYLEHIKNCGEVLGN